MAIVCLGLFVVASAAFSLFSLTRLDPATGQPARAVLGAIVAAFVGVSLIVGGYRGRAPVWLSNLFIGGPDPD
ncbi:MAG: hypothetical protein EXR93_05770 [Gemmatimonadetes bacterium]|nr:hypothetical protein [Gemmatimonadota bacterium]